MAFTSEQLADLTAPLDRASVATRQQAGQTLSYVTAWHVIAEANRIFGFDGWTRETVELRQLGEPRTVDNKVRVGYSARVRVTVYAGERVIIREGCGFGQGIDKDQDQAHESALKEAESDAMKRALMTFGNQFGLALYDKAQTNVADVGSASVDFAIATMRTCQTGGEFKEFWAKNKDGLKADLNAADYRRVVAAMQGEAKRFAPAETPFTPQEAATQ